MIGLENDWMTLGGCGDQPARSNPMSAKRWERFSLAINTGIGSDQATAVPRVMVSLLDGCKVFTQWLRRLKIRVEIIAQFDRLSTIVVGNKLFYYDLDLGQDLNQPLFTLEITSETEVRHRRFRWARSRRQKARCCDLVGRSG